jgi:nicotinamidase-related amidase
MSHAWRAPRQRNFKRTDTGMHNFSFPADWTELVPELEQHPEDHIVSKQRPGAFIGTSLDGFLRQHGVTQVFMMDLDQ